MSSSAIELSLKGSYIMATAHLKLLSRFLFGGETRFDGSRKKSLEAAFSSVIKRQEEKESEAITGNSGILEVREDLKPYGGNT